MKFEYNGKIYNPSNLEKKLKKLGITINDINIIEETKSSNESKLEDYMADLETKIVRSTEDDIRRVVMFKKGTNPSFEFLFRNQIWNPETKTGIKGLTEEFIETMYYES